jgi:hypothetical protein
VKYIGADFSQGDVEVEILGTGTGVFSLEIDLKDTSDVVRKRFVFSEIPVTESSRGTFILSGEKIPVLAYDSDGDGVVDQYIYPEGEGEGDHEGGGHSACEASEQLALLQSAVQNIHAKKLREWVTNKLRVVSKLLSRTKSKNVCNAAEKVLGTVVKKIEKETPKKEKTK